ncbi:Vinorine synthase-like [Quillaja saponaria]|uniref:Vinorine synthase-like n=1 Tax=Quillaja saponaria TaxID=32244 RepID=A0AAD7M444_QUISA|nr:Vinorine synthase-like [Quillaja saponaria]
MKIQVEKISKELIKPSSPTPGNLRHYQLSFLDQISPHVYTPFVYFFSSGDSFNSTDVSNQLKKSLSDILSHYYPFAGRVIDNKFIDCNDEDDAYELTLGVQLNIFDCGGFAIGVCISHKIADGLSSAVFMNSWAALARGGANLVRTHFNSAALFTPKDNTIGFDSTIYITKKNIITKRFVFDASAIEILRAEYVANDSSIRKKPPSRVEVLTAFIWRRFLAVTHGDEKNSYALVHYVNLRPRMEPPLPNYAFGNYYADAQTDPVLVPSDSDQDHVLCYNMVRQVMEKINKFDKDFISKIGEGGEEYLKLLKKDSEGFLRGELVPFMFTSFCRFPLYDADFGWGKPTWVGLSHWTYKNLVIFMDTKTGGGIEAHICLKVEDMDKFENDEEVLAYGSV